MAYAQDLKSCDRKVMRVRLPLWAHMNTQTATPFCLLDLSLNQCILLGNNAHNSPLDSSRLRDTSGAILGQTLTTFSIKIQRILNTQVDSTEAQNSIKKRWEGGGFRYLLEEGHVQYMKEQGVDIQQLGKDGETMYQTLSFHIPGFSEIPVNVEGSSRQSKEH